MILIVTACLFSLAYYQHFTRCAHISQQQYYDYKRYLIYVGNIKETHPLIKLICVGTYIGIAIAISLISQEEWLFLLVSLLGIVALNFANQKPKIHLKGLVFTNRVKRLVITAYVFQSIVFYCVLILLRVEYPLVFFVLTTVLIDIWYEYVFTLFLFLHYPLERIIANHYISKARKKLQLYQPQIIAITGSYGKTTFKNILSSLLKTKYLILASKASYNTPLGICRIVNQELTRFHQVLILEVGVDQVGGMDRFKKIFTPDIVIITEIGMQHLATFKSIQNIVKEKTKLIQFMKADGLAFVHNGNPYLKAYQPSQRNLIRYALEQDGDVVAYHYHTSSEGSYFALTLDGQQEDFYCPLLGRHMMENVIGAIAVARHFEIKTAKMKQVIANLQYVKHRMEVKKDGKWTIMDDSYNSNVKGFQNALEVFATFPKPRILLTPGLVELAGEHERIMFELGKVASQKVDEVILIHQEQTKDFYRGLLESGFIEDQIHVFESYREGDQWLKKKYQDAAISLYIANDLPDFTI